MQPKRPTSVTVIAILHFVFGGLGLLMDTCTGAMLAAGGTGMFARAGQAGRPQELLQDMTRYVEENTPAAQAAQYGELAVDLVISILMIISGVGLLQMRSWGRALSIVYAVLSILLKLVIAVYAVAFRIPAVNEFISQHPNLKPDEALVLSYGKLGAVAGPIFDVLFMIYPIVVLVIMLRPSIAAAFRGEPTGLPVEEDYRDEPPEDGYDRADI